MPSNFMCLVLKLLQIQPDPEIIREYILQEDSKYLRLLGAFYLRLTGKADQVLLLLPGSTKKCNKCITVYNMFHLTFEPAHLRLWVCVRIEEESTCLHDTCGPICLCFSGSI